MTERPECRGFMYAAHKDALAAQTLATADIAQHCEAIAFHCQQAAEKMIKNAYAEKGEAPSKSHDSGDLLAKATAMGFIEASPTEMRAAIDLSFFTVAARYETSPDLSGSEALKAIEDCNTIAVMIERNGYQPASSNAEELAQIGRERSLH